MGNSSWVIDIDDKIYSIVKSKVEQKLKADYPDISFTNSSSTPTTAKFPTVYIHSIGSLESANTLENDEVESVRRTFEVQIKVNTEIGDVQTVAIEVLNAFKSLRFNLISSTSINTVDGITTGIYRFRRYIASNDNI